MVSIVKVLQEKGNDSAEIKAILIATRLKQKECTAFSKPETVAIYMDLGLSCRKYKHLRSTLLKKNYCGFPSSDELTDEKQACVPAHMFVDDFCAKFSFQSVLDQTAQRIIDFIPNFEETCFGENFNMVLYSKWGCDGSSGQSKYKQKLDNDYSDSDMFIISMVPLRLTEDNALCSNINNHATIWENITSSST